MGYCFKVNSDSNPFCTIQNCSMCAPVNIQTWVMVSLFNSQSVWCTEWDQMHTCGVWRWAQKVINSLVYLLPKHFPLHNVPCTSWFLWVRLWNSIQKSGVLYTLPCWALPKLLLHAEPSKTRTEKKTNQTNKQTNGFPPILLEIQFHRRKKKAPLH